MRYGTVEFRRTGTIDNINWEFRAFEPDNVDREPQKEYKPNHSWFFHYPETMSAVEAGRMLLDKRMQEIEEEIAFNLESYRKMKKSYDEYLLKYLNKT